MGKCMEYVYSERATELNRLTKLSFEEKVEKSLEIIEEGLNKNDVKNPVISSSFGKDSVTLIHLVHRIDDSVPVVMNDTGVMFPETKKYARKMEDLWNLKLDVVKPDMTFWDIVDKYGYPRESRNTITGDNTEPKCCKLLKTDPMVKYIKKNDIDLDFIGLCADEGRQRRWTYVSKGSFVYYHKTWSIYKAVPMLFWTIDDVWKYHDVNGIPRNPAYEKYDQKRTGCVTCTGHARWKKEIGKYSEKLLKYILKDMKGQTQLDDFMGSD